MRVVEKPKTIKKSTSMKVVHPATISSVRKLFALSKDLVLDDGRTAWVHVGVATLDSSEVVYGNDLRGTRAQGNGGRETTRLNGSLSDAAVRNGHLPPC